MSTVPPAKVKLYAVSGERRLDRIIGSYVVNQQTTLSSSSDKTHSVQVICRFQRKSVGQKTLPHNRKAHRDPFTSQTIYILVYKSYCELEAVVSVVQLRFGILFSQYNFSCEKSGQLQERLATRTVLTCYQINQFAKNLFKLGSKIDAQRVEILKTALCLTYYTSCTISFDYIEIIYFRFFTNLVPFPRHLVVPMSVSSSFSCICLPFSFTIGININLCYKINLLAHNFDKFEYNIVAMSISLIYLFSIFYP